MNAGPRLVGVRDELVKTDAGNVQSYGTNMMNMADLMAANAFNARGMPRPTTTSTSLRWRASPRRRPDLGVGYARKTRSPNLYERYTWGRGTMAMTMTNWFGDGSGYVGNIDLKPEVAHTLSHRGLACGRQEGSEPRWFFRLTPYFSYVENYIDADVIGSFNPYSVAPQARCCRFANRCRLYGINASWKWPLLRTAGWATSPSPATPASTRGKRVDGGNLYHLMPFNVLAR
jgi:iron complex outermembrane receptor protein